MRVLIPAVLGVLVLLDVQAAAEPRGRFRSLDAEAWAHLLDHDRRREPGCTDRDRIVGLARLEGTRPIGPVCPLDLAPEKDLRGSDMRRVMVFDVTRIDLGTADLYLLSQEIATARLAAFTILYWVGDDDRHGIVAYGPTDGEVRLLDASANRARLAVSGSLEGDRYDTVMGRAPSPGIEAEIEIDDKEIRLLERRIIPARKSE